MRQSSMRCQTVNSVQLQQIPRTYILVSMSPVSWWRMTNVPLSKQCYKMHCFKSKLLFDWAMGGLMTFSFMFQHKRKLRNSWVVPLTWFHRQSRSPKWSRCFLWPLLLLFSFLYTYYIMLTCWNDVKNRNFMFLRNENATTVLSVKVTATV